MDKQGLYIWNISLGHKSKAFQPHNDHPLDFLFAIIVTPKLIASVIFWAESFEQTEQGIVRKVVTWIG